MSTDKGEVGIPAKAVCADFYAAFAVADLDLMPVGVSVAEYSREKLGELGGSDVILVPALDDATTPDPQNGTMTGTLRKAFPACGRTAATRSSTAPRRSAPACMETVLGELRSVG